MKNVEKFLKQKTITDAQRLRELLPADPIEMTDAEVADLMQRASSVRNISHLPKKIEEMRRRRDAVKNGTDDDGSDWCIGSKWYWMVYLSDARSRRESVILHMVSYAAG